MMPVGFFWFCPVYLTSRFERFCFLETDNDNIECFELTTVQVLRISNCTPAMGSSHDSFPMTMGLLVSPQVNFIDVLLGYFQLWMHGEDKNYQASPKLYTSGEFK